MKTYEEIKGQLGQEDKETLAEIGWNYLQAKKGDGPE